MFGFVEKQKGNLKKEIGVDTAKNKLKVIKIQTQCFHYKLFQLLLSVTIFRTSLDKCSKKNILISKCVYLMRFGEQLSPLLIIH